MASDREYKKKVREAYYGRKNSKAQMYVKILVAVILILAIVLIFSRMQVRPGLDFGEQAQLKTFSSEAELKDFLIEKRELGYGGYYLGGVAARTTLEATAGAPSAAPSAGPDAQQKADDYSTTNVQIAGVDEADFVKNDGKYIYTISGENVVIVDAFPAESAQIVSTINLSGKSPQQVYINGDRLVVFGNIYGYYYGGPVPLEKIAAPGTGSSGAGVAQQAAESKIAAPAIAPDIGILPPVYSEPTTYIKVYDVSDRSNPVIKKDIVLNGTYFNSRMIGNYVYAIVTTQPYYIGSDIIIPRFSPTQAAFPEVYYFPVPDYSYQFTNILSLNVKDESSEINNKVFLLGYSNSLFVSENNIYMVYQKQVDQRDIFERILVEVIMPALPPDVADEISSIQNSDKSENRKMGEIQLAMQEWFEEIGPEEAAKFQQSLQEKYDQIYAEISKEMEKSVAHKISISNGNIEYKTKGEVPGQPLNQFSMDENNGYFRIATTTNDFSGRGSSLNHLYVLDENMNIVGKVEDLAKGERIFSARFIGDRAYLVTFVRIDPLFVIDLSDPANPKVLGELKIPGVSDYLHPYDENHIIGIGRAADDTQGRVTFNGVKLSLFDVSDVANPRETSKYEIGSRGTDSEALRDHKAFLFSKAKNLLVLPVLLVESEKDYWQPSWQGAYVFNLDIENGFTLKGRVTHSDQAPDKEQYYYYYGPYSITRSLYMDDTLYTVSSSTIKANGLEDMEEISKVELPFSQPYPGVVWGAIE